MPIRKWPFTFSVAVASVVLTAAYLTDQDVEWAFGDAHVWDGQLWRHVTSCFVHVNILHLVFNLYWLRVFGAPLEVWFKPGCTAVLFVALAAGSGAAEFLTGSGGIGLSGVVYGYFGLLYATRDCPAPHSYVLTRATVRLLVGWFFLCILLTWADVWLIGNVAHASGAILGYSVGRGIRAKTRPRFYLGLVGASVIGAVMLTLYMPWDYHWWWHRADKLHAAGRSDEAYDASVHAVDCAPSDDAVAELLPWVAYAGLTRCNVDMAIEFYRRALRVQPDSESARYWLAVAHLLKGDEEAAARVCPGVTADGLAEYFPDCPELRKVLEKRGTDTQPSTHDASP